MGNLDLCRYTTAAVIALGAKAVLEIISGISKRGGLDLEKASRHGIERREINAPVLKAL
jgi:hypothetical protein